MQTETHLSAPPFHPSGQGPSHYRDFTAKLTGHTTLGTNTLEEWSARSRDLYLRTHNSRWRQTSMPSARFEPIIPASEWPQTHALHRAATTLHSTKTENIQRETTVINWKLIQTYTAWANCISNVKMGCLYSKQLQSGECCKSLWNLITKIPHNYNSLCNVEFLDMADSGLYT
jgi:hypothetical protein